MKNTIQSNVKKICLTALIISLVPLDNYSTDYIKDIFKGIVNMPGKAWTGLLYVLPGGYANKNNTTKEKTTSIFAAISWGMIITWRSYRLSKDYPSETKLKSIKNDFDKKFESIFNEKRKSIEHNVNLEKEQKNKYLSEYESLYKKHTADYKNVYNTLSNKQNSSTSSKIKNGIRIFFGMSDSCRAESDARLIKYQDAMDNVTNDGNKEKKEPKDDIGNEKKPDDNNDAIQEQGDFGNKESHLNKFPDNNTKYGNIQNSKLYENMSIAYKKIFELDNELQKNQANLKHIVNQFNNKQLLLLEEKAVVTDLENKEKEFKILEQEINIQKGNANLSDFKITLLKDNTANKENLDKIRKIENGLDITTKLGVKRVELQKNEQELKDLETKKDDFLQKDKTLKTSLEDLYKQYNNACSSYCDDESKKFLQDLQKNLQNMQNVNQFMQKNGLAVNASAKSNPIENIIINNLFLSGGNKQGCLLPRYYKVIEQKHSYIKSKEKLATIRVALNEEEFNEAIVSLTKSHNVTTKLVELISKKQNSKPYNQKKENETGLFPTDLTQEEAEKRFKDISQTIKLYYRTLANKDTDFKDTCNHNTLKAFDALASLKLNYDNAKLALTKVK